MGNSYKYSEQSKCPTCDYDSFKRNNYFNGKLLVERDFTDEQKYYINNLMFIVLQIQM